MKVSYIDHMGTDLSVVNAARVSFSKNSDWNYNRNDAGVELSEPTLCKADKGLIRFLARGCTSGNWNSLINDIYECTEFKCEDDVIEIVNFIKNMPAHWTPFGHTAITLHIEAPIFIARQLGKHQVGLTWNEVSRRYVATEPEFYEPNVWRQAADNVKQGSSDTPVTSIWSECDEICCPPDGKNWKDIKESVERNNFEANELYLDMINSGVCPEQARMVLPQSMYTEWYWTGNLYAFANVYKQRSDSHAQREVQEVAKQIEQVIEPLFPESWKALCCS